MADLRKAARGKPCMIRLPGCTGGGDDVVLAHYRLAGTCGMGMKPPDILGAWSCASCHDIADGRKRVDMERDFIRLAHAEGCLRTLNALVKDGLFKGETI